MKKRVSSSNLNLRFYKSDGWTREDIEPYLVKGYLNDSAEMFGDREDLAYYVLGMNTRLVMKRFYEEKVGEVFRAFDDYPNWTDLEFLENW